jgi:cobalamin biosynthesis protein CobT
MPCQDGLPCLPARLPASQPVHAAPFHGSCIVELVGMGGNEDEASEEDEGEDDASEEDEGEDDASEEDEHEDDASEEDKNEDEASEEGEDEGTRTRTTHRMYTFIVEQYMNGGTLRRMVLEQMKRPAEVVYTYSHAWR